MVSTERDRNARLAMIELAERLFAEQGIEAVSMRQIAIGSGQRNNSAVAYHFGSRSGLVRAVLEHRSTPIDTRRLELIAQIGAERCDLGQALRVFVQPLAEIIGSDRPGWYLRFLADATSDPHRSELVPGTEPEGVLWVNRQLGRLCEIPATVLHRRLRWMVVITLSVLADHERRAAATGEVTDVDAIVADLTATLTALFATDGN